MEKVDDTNEVEVWVLDNNQNVKINLSQEDYNNQIRVKTVKGLTRLYLTDGMYELHREVGPAVICKTGHIAYFKNGLCHRTDGPAIIWASGKQTYTINGIDYEKDKFDNFFQGIEEEQSILPAISAILIAGLFGIIVNKPKIKEAQIDKKIEHKAHQLGGQ